jgi:membrane-associated tyrosine/threonine-specific cdc2-inhibitory kinase
MHARRHITARDARARTPSAMPTEKIVPNIGPFAVDADDARTPENRAARRGRDKISFSPLSVLLHPISPASVSPSPGARDDDDDERTNPARLFSFDAARAMDVDEEPRTPRVTTEDGVFARETDAEARWGAATPNAFAETTAPSVEEARRRSKTRSADLDAMGGFDFRDEGEDEDAAPGMFRVFGRDIGKPPLFSSFGAQKSGNVTTSSTRGSGSEGRDGSLGSSWGSRHAADDGVGGALSRMNSLAETKVLTSTLLVRQTSVSGDAEFDFDDHFRFEQQIGCSKTSEVWLVTSKTSGRAFVVKKCVRSFTTDTQRAEYKREVEAAAMLPEHPNIVRYYRSWQKEQLFYIQMEHCACGSLAGVLARLPRRTLLDETDVWRLAAQVASGLAHMHDHGVLHLDVKPDNIYIDVDGTYKIGDLGLAYARGRGWDWEEGDGGYVAPELLNMFPGEEPAPSADVFSLGVTLYEAASGETFPRGATPRAALPPLPDGRSPELAKLIDGCLVADLSTRATARDVCNFARETLAALGKS